MKVLRASDRKVSAWKNGGGTTREIAVYPPGSGFDDFGWRVSMATVASSGSFSTFAGIDRILTVLSGSMNLLAIGRDPVVLTAASDPFAFPGDLGIYAKLVGGEVEDLNVMTRRGSFAATVTRMAIAGDGLEHQVAPNPTILLCEHGGVDVKLDDRVEQLEKFDAVMFDRRDTNAVRVRTSWDASLLLVEIRTQI